jgi:dihydroxyacetone kinase-like predicted kinase
MQKQQKIEEMKQQHQRQQQQQEQQKQTRKWEQDKVPAEQSSQHGEPNPIAEAPGTCRLAPESPETDRSRGNTK